jgi:hypothetical protein
METRLIYGGTQDTNQVGRECRTADLAHSVETYRILSRPRHMAVAYAHLKILHPISEGL